MSAKFQPTDLLILPNQPVFCPPCSPQIQSLPSLRVSSFPFFPLLPFSLTNMEVCAESRTNDNNRSPFTHRASYLITDAKTLVKHPSPTENPCWLFPVTRSSFHFSASSGFPNSTPVCPGSISISLLRSRAPLLPATLKPLSARGRKPSVQKGLLLRLLLSLHMGTVSVL